MGALNGSPSNETSSYVIRGAASLNDQDRRALGRRILSTDEFAQNFPNVEASTMSRADMRNSTE